MNREITIRAKAAIQAEITEGYLSYLLAGKRNARYKTALRLADLFGTNPAIWLHDDGTVGERQAAWDEYKRGAERWKKNIQTSS